MPPNRVQSIKYERIDDSESASGGNSTTHAELQSHRTSYFNIFTLHLTLSFVSGICFAFLLSKINLFGGHDSYGSGFKTEIESLRPAISLVKTRFSGTLRYKDGDHLYIDLGPQGVRYFGIPTREVDDAWAGLIGNHEGAFSGDILGPDVLHSLHCLNEVRKILDSPHYYNRTLEELNRGRRMHIDHCLNHIRQIIQCHMDLTPVRTVYYEDINVEVGEFDQEHMCRDIGKLHQYMDKHHTATTGSSQKIHDGRVHRLGYPDTEEEMMGWDHREREFD